ncbi:MAG: cysteine desulfurase family protein [Chthonomonadaceae bacterium]|nr:cysteine desulfurase family protein [Chthonomonadaceae bacterium]
MNAFDIAWVRAQFPALTQTDSGQPLVFFDNPGGTQVTQGVISAVSDYYRTSNANIGGAFATSRRTDATLHAARSAMAAMLNASEEELVFGANMTTLTFHLARSIGETLRPGDEIVLTNLDHDANVTPWLDLAAQGAVIKFVDFDPTDCTLDPAQFQAALSDRTRLVAITHASNAVGTVPNVAALIRMAHAVGARAFVDAVQFAPHGAIDVRALDCDFLACSAYKFFGPHAGILFGKAEHLRQLTPHKVRPARDTLPYRWETGTQNHEGMAGIAAAVAHLQEIGKRSGESAGEGARAEIVAGMNAIHAYERGLAAHLLEGLAQLPDVQLYGLTDLNRLDERVPTFAFTWPRLSPRATAEYLGEHGICCWNGNYYALRLMERLGLEAHGGAVRIGLAHYNTIEEIDRLLNLLHDCK